MGEVGRYGISMVGGWINGESIKEYKLKVAELQDKERER